jgi:CPA2 family monovalent cation:H+ antiporter-2
MVDIRRILCPIDFSDASRHALDQAVVLAKWHESRITALHVIHVPLFLPPPMLVAELADTTPPAPSRQTQKEELQAWLETARRAGVQTDVIVDEGHAATRILEQASSCRADLIAMGTHGLSGFERFMLGSVAEKVLRKAACPVITVPPAAAMAARIPYRRLLCPVDFSESSLTALQVALSLAEKAEAELTILHVFDWPPDDELLTQWSGVSDNQFVEDETHARLAALVTDDVRVWCNPSTKVSWGKPYREILQMAQSEGVDLIVIGVCGRNPVDLTLFGSTTNQVVRRASCPVLTVKQ